jgi:hypothetical protein
LDEFFNRIQPLMRGPALPVPIFVSLHFVEAGVLAHGDFTLHAVFVTQERGSRNVAIGG